MLELDIQLQRRSFDICVQETFSKKITGVFGHSGAGKSSLLHAIAGLCPVEQGRITFEDEVWQDTNQNIFVKPHLRKVGLVFQDARLFPHMTVLKNLTYGRPRASTLSVEFVTDLLDITPLLHSYPHACSGGEQQRIAIGRCLLSEPRLMLLDEPFSAVDMTLRQQILPYLNDLKEQLDLQLMVVSHDLPDLLSLSPELLLLEQGQVVSHGHIQDCVQQQHSYNLIHGTGLMNHLRVNVIHVDHDGWVELKLSKGDHDAQLWIESRTITTTGGELQLQLSPDDIVLAREACFETSMRNKIKGIIQTITEHEQCCLVVVDIGQPLICSISKNAKLTMQLCEGDAIFCHFKSQSIHLLN